MKGIILAFAVLGTSICAEEKQPAVTEQPKFTNRLAKEKSPYLLQHAHNPVDWFAWGEEAFAKARKENKPIFLSVGYSTCHWCHVMEHESFESEEIAKILNAHFISIKVDREERPDIDRVYMSFVQATTGGGGWPMNVWLTPELKPFFGGTYFPPEDKWGHRGFKSVLNQINEIWTNERDKVLASAEEMTKALQQTTALRPTTAPVEAALLEECYVELKHIYEPRYGGFGSAPKFPRPVAYNFLLRYQARSGTKDALDMVLHTLNKMADGGMHDHIGGGFARYSVDGQWHVPHFEKMLYDNAQLAISHLEAYQITRNEFYADTARDIFEYVLRDMTGKDGQFYSAEDADSTDPKNPAHKIEGAFYVWEQKEIEDALGVNAAAIFNHYYGIKPDGNAPSDPHGEFKNKNILIVSASLDDTAKKFGKAEDEIGKILADAHKKLFAIRAKRPRPHLDDKTLTAWNGLMISAFARAAQVLDSPKYLGVAQKATAFIETTLYDEKRGVLLRRYRDGEAAIDGYLDDYAFFIQALLDLYEASFEVKYLTWALDLQKKQDELFWDAMGGGYFHTEAAAKDVLVRLKEDYDGAEPAPNSVATLNLLRLAQMTDNKDFREKADKTLAAFAARLGQHASAMPQMLVALDFSLSKPKQIIIAGTRDAADTKAMLREINSRFIPNKIFLLADGGDGQHTLAKNLKFLETVKSLGGKATAYICQDYTCQLPTNDVAELIRQLERK